MVWKEDRVLNFGCLCCNVGQVSGIREFNLPPELDQLYTDQEDPTAKRLREKSRLFGNGMAMSSLTIEKEWKNRCYNNKMSSMLTASGQFFRFLISCTLFLMRPIVELTDYSPHSILTMRY